MIAAAGDPRDCRSGPGSETGEAAFFASEAAKAAASGSPRYSSCHLSWLALSVMIGMKHFLHAE